MTAIQFFDVRSEYEYDPTDKAEKLYKGKVVVRDPKTIDSICLHQTAVTFGVTASMVKAAGGDPALAQFMRAKRVNAHVTAFDEGAFVLAYPLRNFVYHGNGANTRSIGLEIEGRFNGQPGGEYSEPTDLVIEAACAAVEQIISEATKEGILLRHIIAHRQYSSSRQGDPGWRLWQKVAVEFAEKKCGLMPIPMLAEGGGRAIPKIWDGRQTAKY